MNQAREELKKLINLNQEEQEDFTQFDGNAQGFRVLTKLQILDDDKGLNLTFATLATYLKYPNTGKIVNWKLEKIINRKKRGRGISYPLQLNCRHASTHYLFKSGDSIKYK